MLLLVYASLRRHHQPQCRHACTLPRIICVGTVLYYSILACLHCSQTAPACGAFKCRPISHSRFGLCTLSPRPLTNDVNMVYVTSHIRTHTQHTHTHTHRHTHTHTHTHKIHMNTHEYKHTLTKYTPPHHAHTKSLHHSHTNPTSAPHHSHKLIPLQHPHALYPHLPSQCTHSTTSTHKHMTTHFITQIHAHP
jgi:hypothetical protein